MTASRAYVNARITPAILPEPWHEALTECAGDDCRCKRGDPVHPPLLMTFDPGRREYRQALRATCSAVWELAMEGRDRGRHCGEPATHQVADVFLCGPHYRRMRVWMNTRDQRDQANAMRTAQVVHENQLRLDRERAQEQRELTMQQREADKENARLRMLQAKALARQQIELDRERIRAEETARAEASRVYFVQRESDGLIKIGTSRTLAARMVSLKREHGPLQVLAVIGGAHKEESALHRQFRELRAEGEWFRPELPLLEHVLAVMKKHPVTPDPGLPPIMDHRVIWRAVHKIKREGAEERRQEYWDEQDRMEAEAAAEESAA